MFLNLHMTSNSIFEQFSAWKVLFGIKDEIFQKVGPCKPLYQLFRVFSSKLQPKNLIFQTLSSPVSQIKNTQVKEYISIGSRNCNKRFMHKSAFSWLNFTLVSTLFLKHGKRLNIQSFSRKKFLWQKCLLNKSDRPKLICFIMKCCYNA